MFPVQRVNKQNQTRMFIVAIIQYLLKNRLLDRYRDSVYQYKDILRAVMDLNYFDCFDKQMTEANVRKAINEEIERNKKDYFIYRKLKDRRRKYR